MGKRKEAATGKKPTRRYWAKPKIPIGLRLEETLVERAQKAAKFKAVTFTALVSAGLEREIYAAYREHGGEPK